MRFGLQAKLLLPTVGLVVMGLFATTYLGDRASYQAIEETVRGQQIQTAEGIVRNAELWMQNRLREGENWAETDVYSKAMEDSLLGKTARKAAQARLEKLLSGFGMYEAILLVSSSGETVVAASPKNPEYPLDPTGDPAFAAALAGEASARHAIASPITGQPISLLYFPLRKGARSNGVLIAAVDLRAFGKDFLVPLARNGSTEAFIADREGRIFLNSDPGKDLKLKVADLGLSIDQLMGESGVLHYRAGGDFWMAAHQYLQPLAWAVVVANPESVVFAGARQARAISIMAALICVALVGFGVYLTGRMGLAPIRQMVLALKDLSQGEGDLTHRLAVRTRDEIGELAEYFNHFIEKLQQSISRVKTSAARVEDATRQLTEISTDTARIVKDQGHGTEMIAVAVNQMTATAQSVSANANEASRSTQNADHQASDGRDVVNASVASINMLAAEVEQSAAAIESLRLGSNKIGGVIDVIEGIAEQTNLLALNAAIEAARAGEQGRGFAVVAQEVRTLAQRSRGSTEEIRQMIATLQQEASAAVDRTQSTRDRARETIELASRAGESLDSITGAIKTISTMNDQIATAAEEQSAVSEEINRNVASIQAISERTSKAAESVESSARELARADDELTAVVAQFKV